MDAHLLDDAQSSEHLDSVQPDTRSTKSQRTPKPTVHADFVYNLPAPRIKSGVKRTHSESNNGADAASDKKRRKSMKIETVEEPEMNGDCIKQEEFQELHTVTNGDSDQANPESPTPRIKIIDCSKKARTPKSAKKPKSLTNGAAALQLNKVDTINVNDCHTTLENGIKAEQTVVVNSVNDQLVPATQAHEPSIERDYSQFYDGSLDATLTSVASNEQYDGADSERMTRSPKSPKTRKPTLMTYILLALSEHPDGMSGLAEIYEYIRNVSDRYRHLQTEWRSSVRNCLSSSRRFMKHPRPINNQKQRGALWALNPDHPANGPLIAAPKDASKFVSRDPPSTPKNMRKVFKINGHFKQESPMPDFMDFDNCSTLSGEDLSRRSYTPLSTRHSDQPAQIRLPIVSNDDRIAVQAPNADQYNGTAYSMGHYTPVTTTQNSQCQYVYYLPSTSAQISGRPMQIIVQPASTYKPVEEVNGITNGDGLIRYETSATSNTYQVVEPVECMYTANQYPSSTQWPEYLNDEDGEQQENWLPRPLAPKLHRVAESELRALNNSNPVYFQL